MKEKLKVHISQVGENKMRISWITDSPTSPKVSYGPSPSANALSVTGTTSSYRYLFYKSGEIHDVVIGPLNPNTVYYYRLGDPPSSLTYNFKTPPSQLPIKFAVVGGFELETKHTYPPMHTHINHLTKLHPLI
ncbi:purple acid phosphatase [Vigna angularis]|uniref:Purple acid phosphatase n=1 Tax=Phaseolus angularis TaxID=3914 RepID=A0A8T0KRQ6_PHAAN|nr:purple acid phosphatase [Vigna angularis]